MKSTVVKCTMMLCELWTQKKPKQFIRPNYVCSGWISGRILSWILTQLSVRILFCFHQTNLKHFQFQSYFSVSLLLGLRHLLISIFSFFFLSLSQLEYELRNQLSRFAFVSFVRIRYSVWWWRFCIWQWSNR